jgi:cell division initiation protein
MKVTPLDLRQQRFNTVMRGYDRGEVTAFLNEVADDYENALREADRPCATRCSRHRRWPTR